MGDINTIGSRSVSKTKPKEKQAIKVKLRITIIVALAQNDQQAQTAKAFRSGDYDAISQGDTLADKLVGATVSYEDEEEEEYKCIDECFVVNEASPKGMEVMMNQVNSYINGFIINPDYEEIVLFIFVPTFNIDSSISDGMFHTFRIDCLTKEKLSPKIVVKKSCILFGGVDRISFN